MKKPDPRVLLLFAACFSGAAVFINKTALLAVMFIIAAIPILIFGVEIIELVNKLKGFILTIALVALLQSILQKGGVPLITIGKLRLITAEGLASGLNILLRLGIVIGTASVFSISNSRQMAQALIQIGIPYEIAFMSLIALRFLPSFTEEFKDVLVAVQLRGVDTKKIPLFKKLELYIGIITPVVLHATIKAQKLSYAIELRAFRAFPTRTSRFTLKLCAMDYVYITVILTITAVIIILL
jgi:energy-coupling factor transport system permease protein